MFLNNFALHKIHFCSVCGYGLTTELIRAFELKNLHCCQLFLVGVQRAYCSQLHSNQSLHRRRTNFLQQPPTCSEINNNVNNTLPFVYGMKTISSLKQCSVIVWPWHGSITNIARYYRSKKFNQQQGIFWKFLKKIWYMIR